MFVLQVLANFREALLSVLQYFNHFQQHLLCRFILRFRHHYTSNISHTLLASSFVARGLPAGRDSPTPAASRRNRENPAPSHNLIASTQEGDLSTPTRV